LAARPDLNVQSLRGNVDTRLKKAEDGTYDAVVLAAAGLERLGLGGRITELLPVRVSMPAVGQGALAIESRAFDEDVLPLLKCLNDETTRREVEAERAFLRTVEGGCQVPVGVYAVFKENALNVEAVIASLDGKKIIRESVRGDLADAEKIGAALAEKMLDFGGREIMQSIGL
jgi:hydroxymethylbilane synthase